MAIKFKDTDDGGDGGFLGFLGNLGGDIKDAAFGLPGGIKTLFTQNPITTAKNLYDYYGEYSPFGPLFTGDFGEAAKRFQEHPLGPILDVGAIFTGGGSLLGKVQKSIGRAPSTKALTRDLSLGLTKADLKRRGLKEKDIVPDIFKTYSSNPATRMRQKRMEPLVRGMSKWFPGLGDVAKYERAFKKEVSGRKTSKAEAIRLAPTLFRSLSDKFSDPTSANIVFNHMHGQLKTHAFKVDGTQKLPKGMRYVSDTVGDLFKGNFDEALAMFGRKATTPNIAKAARDADGNYLVVPKHASKRFGDEAKKSSAFVKVLWKYPNTAWKWILLGTRPAYLVNNTIGTTAMHMITAGPVDFAMGLYSSIRASHGEKKANEFLGEGYKMLNQGYKKKYIMDIYEGVFHDIGAQLKLGGGSKSAKAANALAGGMLRPAHYIEQILRGMNVDDIVRNTPEVQQMMKEGMNLEQAGSRFMSDPAHRAWVKTELENRLGQYYHYNKAEKAIREFVPFYGWDRAIVRHVRHLHGAKKDALANLGFMGAQETEEWLEGAPDWMKGLLSVGEEGESALGIPGMPDRVPMLSTSGLNPYATIGELSGSALGEAPAELLSGVNPFVSSGIGVVTGKHPVTKAPIENVGVGIPGAFATMFKDVLENLPQTKLVNAAMGKPGSTYEDSAGRTQPFLFSKQIQEMLAAYLGIPVKQVSKTAATRQVNKQKVGIL